ncbi:GDSL esterase/lipase [Trifolium pratense]|uniref:GDSL esterase/lipase n=1 Tax=Trifolium pratense TaxID=57577 RepID=A0A2K3MR93_TRIPR|nr:GDSL esterase/lipase [Trifolium pratense]
MAINNTFEEEEAEANNYSCRVETLTCVSFFVVLLSISTATIVIGSSSNSECNFPAIFNFGDSNSDTGGLAASLLPPTPPYGDTYFHRPEGRFSNGRLVIDFIGN